MLLSCPNPALSSGNKASSRVLIPPTASLIPERSLPELVSLPGAKLLMRDYQQIILGFVTIDLEAYLYAK